MEKIENNISIVNFSSYSRPAVVETTGRKYVTYGENNDYYQYLIDRANGSPTNNSLITGISDLIYGDGISATNSTNKPNDYANMVALFRKEDLKRIAIDLKMMGNCAFQVIYDKGHKTITEVAHIPIESLRSERANDDGVVDGYYYAPDWKRIGGVRKPQRISAFGTSTDGMEILFMKPYKPGYFYYSPVDYIGGVGYAELEEEILNYHITNIQNGFSGTTLINFNNGQVTTNDEKIKIERKIQKKFSGTSGQKIVLSFNDGVETETHMETVQLSDAHSQYEFLSNEASKKILISHRGFGMLFGMETSTGFGNNADEIKNASIYMNAKVIKPFQEIIIDGMDKILQFNKISLDLFFKEQVVIWDTEMIDETNSVEKIQDEQDK